jgi:hypothetical protein
MTVVIEINDTAVQLYQGDRPLLESPGFAILEDREVIVGTPAAAQARLRPNRVQNRFWDLLSTEELAKPVGAARSHADLAYSHLRSLWAEAGGADATVVFAVPGTYDKAQLALLLGMARECGMQVTGLVDAAVAASAKPLPGRHLLYLDVFLHRTVLTFLEQGRRLRRTRVEDIAALGLSHLFDAWANRIADVFIEETRFDPLHVAQTEQRLYDRLPEWLRRLETEGRVTLEVPSSGKAYQVTVKREQLLQATAPLLGQIAEQIAVRVRDLGPFALQVPQRIAAVPGLIESLGQLTGGEVIVLEPNAVARGVLRHSAALGQTGEAVRFITSVPWHDAPVQAPTTATSAASTPSSPAPSAPAAPEPANTPQQALPTHVVVDGYAFRLPETPAPLASILDDTRVSAADSAQLGIGRAGVELASRAPVTVNGRAWRQGEPLHTGDRILLPSGLELLLVRVTADHAA